ncbi:MAG: hypothetical protein LBH92_00665 [Bacteroidales bacterium]|nr:hypothetical protein [Bacteroidales bacterium]
MIYLKNTHWLETFPFTHQHDTMDCGPACLQMIAKYYGKGCL